MKSSKYNVFINKDENHTILFNDITKKYIIVSSKFIESYKQIIHDPNKYASYEIFKDIVFKLQAGGFIILDEINEYEEIKTVFMERRKSPVYSLLIMTTYDCNLNCWYCFQHHQSMKIEASTEERIIKHIKNYLSKNNITLFDLSWFGGEPLLNTEVIENISRFAISYCQEHGVEFNCSITTNGTLLSKDIIEKFKYLHFSDFQITIDGSKEHHNLTNKNISNSFDVILKNVLLVVQGIPNAKVTLRINYTNKNISDDFPRQIDEYLHPIRDRIILLFRQVWQERDNNIMDSYITKTMVEFKEMGYNVKHDFNDFSILSCYVEKEHYLSVFPNGAVDYCNNKPLEKARGYLDVNGNVIWREQASEKRRNIFEIESECKQCKYLPICLGPCPASREDNASYIKCNIKKREEVFKHQILQFCSISGLHEYE